MGTETISDKRPAAEAANTAAIWQICKSAFICFEKPVLVLLLTVAVSVGVCLYVFNAFRVITAYHEKEYRAMELAGIIVHLDEVLTSSAQMAAATGDPKWERRYRKYEPYLDSVIKEAASLMNTSEKEYADYTDAADIKLVAMEDTAFRLVREGRYQDALRILNDPKYEAQKLIYANGVSQFSKAMRNYTKNNLLTAKYIVWGTSVSIILIVTIAQFLYFSKSQLRKHFIESNRMATIVDSSDDAIISGTLEGIVTSWNKGAEKMYGYRPDEMVGKSLSTLIPPERQDELSHILKRISQGEHIKHFETIRIRKDGDRINVSLTISPIKSIEGKINGMSLMARDITERKEAEKVKERLVAVLEATPDFVGYADAKDKHVVYINKAGRKMCGIGEDEDVTKMKISDAHPEWTNKIFSEEAFPVVMRDGVWMGECAFMNIKDGHETPVLMVLASHKGSNGEVEIFSTISRDITERKQMGELQVARQAAEAANSAKSMFLASMSHEIRTPMNAIIGFSDILSEENLTGEQQNYVKLITDSSKHLLQVINDILDFSKIEAGKIDIEMGICAVGDILLEIEAMMKQKTEAKGLEFGIHSLDHLPVNIRTDSNRLRQCLINLVSNAVKFTEKGHIFINVSSEDRNGQPYIRFDVEDTGIGIPAEKQEKVFESFTQADGSTSRRYGGTGLGLTITKKLTELLGGEIALKSEAGKGSTFSIAIPVGLDVSKQLLPAEALKRHMVLP